MVERLIKALIFLCLIVACVFLVLYVLGQLGIAIPSMIVNIIWVVVLLVVLLYLWRAFGGYLNNP